MPSRFEPPIPSTARARTWRRYWRFWGGRAASDVDDELQFHLEMRVHDYLARGMSEADARAAAAARLGDVAAARGSCIAISTRREQRMIRAQAIDAFAQDISFALRTLGRQKTWTTVAVLTLALGIGANTAVFSVVSSLLLHPLPYPHADRVATIFLEPTQGNQTGMRVMVSIRPPVFQAWRASSHSFDALEAYSTSDVILRAPRATPTILGAGFILPTFSQFAGEHPLLGRGILPSDIATGAKVVALGEAVWRTRFGGDANIIGKVIDLDHQLYTIVGVMPAQLRLPRLLQDVTDIWLPLDLRDKNTAVSGVGRLRKGITVTAAESELDSIANRVAVADGTTESTKFRSRVLTASHLVRYRQSLLLLSGAVALVLLIACANVAHLLLARSMTRQRELAIRAALGAGRGRIFRQLLTESVVLSLLGAAGGLLVGWGGLRVLVSLRPESVSELSMSHLDGTTLAVTTVVALLTGIAFGVIGVAQAARLSTHDALKAGAASTSTGRPQGRLRGLLVVSEMALSMVLLIGAALLVRSVVHLETIDPGFDPERLFAIDLPLGHSDREAQSRAPAVFELLARVRAMPGVVGATLATAAPPARAFMIGSLEVDGFPPPAEGATSFLTFNGVAPDYFSVVRMPLLAGRTFADTSVASRDVIVNQGFARKYWPGQSALGRRIRIRQMDGSGPWLTISGLAQDALTGGMTSDAAEPTLYVPKLEFGQYLHPGLLVRTARGQNPLPAIRTLVAGLDPSEPPPKIRDIADSMSKTIAWPRFMMMLLASFTVLAVVLAAVGLYGVMTYAVARRTREIGIRLALGATPRAIGRAVIARGMALAVVGAVLGVAGAAWGTKAIEKMLYGIPRMDLVSFGVSATVLLLVTFMACIVPTRRALRVDPLIAMRAE